jgi:hypothetical protein
MAPLPIPHSWQTLIDFLSLKSPVPDSWFKWNHTLLSLRVLFISLSTCSKFIHIVACISNSFLFVAGFELRASHLLSAGTLPLEPCPQPISALAIFQVASHIFLQGQPRLWSSYLCLPSSWDDRHAPRCLAYWLTWGGLWLFCLGGFLPPKWLELQVWAIVPD